MILLAATLGVTVSCSKGGEQGGAGSAGEAGASGGGALDQAIGGRDMPKGVALAATPEATGAALERAGFKLAAPCSYVREDGVFVTLAISDASPCEAGQPAYVVRYTGPQTREESDAEIVRLNKRFGGTCEAVAVECEWAAPKGLPGVRKVTLDRRMGERVTTSVYSNPPPAAPRSTWPPAAQAHADLAPAGVILGVKLADARAALVALGFKEVGNCRFGMTVGRKRDQVALIAGAVGPGRDDSCEDQAPVRHIEHSLEHDQASPEVMAALNKAVGAPAACQYERPQDARCAWNTPASYPLAQVIFVTTAPRRTILTLIAVDDLGRPNTTPPDYPPAFDPLAGVGDVAPTKPGGVGLGQSLAEVRDGLTKAGFKLQQDGARGADASCIWVYDRPYEVEINVDLLASTTGAPSAPGAAGGLCQGDGVVKQLLFRKTDKRPAAFAAAPTAGEAMAAWVRQIPAPPARSRLCPTSADPTYAMCGWRDLAGPSGPSHVSISFRSSPTDKRNLVSVALEAVAQ